MQSKSEVNYQDVLAKCYVAMSEVDYDLSTWRLEWALSDPRVIEAWRQMIETNALTRQQSRYTIVP